MPLPVQDWQGGNLDQPDQDPEADHDQNSDQAAEEGPEAPATKTDPAENPVDGAGCDSASQFPSKEFTEGCASGESYQQSQEGP